MLDLPQNQIHLWFAFDEEIDDLDLLSQYRRLLTEEERAQEKRFYFARHQRQYLVTRALVRTVLSRYSSIPPERWRFVKNAYGRPSISAEDDPTGQLVFNLSHTEGLIVCGVAHRQTIGVDVENIQRRQLSLDIADRFFSPSEAATLLTVPLSRRKERFLHYWTLKESYIKAKGKGLSIPLDHFSFNSCEASDISISFDESLRDSPEQWRFWLVRPSPEHLAAVCIERSGAEQHLIARKVVPLRSDSLLDYQTLRYSR